MRTGIRKLITTASLLCGAAFAVQAHHSYPVLFDPSTEVSVSGTVREFQFQAPHSYIRIDAVGSDGVTTPWELETASPGQLIRLGITAESLQPGDRIAAAGNPARDGRRLMRLRLLTLPDGREIQIQ